VLSSVHGKDERLPRQPGGSRWIQEDPGGIGGYPEEEDLEKIRSYPIDKSIHEPDELMKFIRSHWEFADWGWSGEDEETAARYHTSTGGWSGNELLIGALQENRVFWSLHWEESRRGGHYKFEVRKRSESQGSSRGAEGAAGTADLPSDSVSTPTTEQGQQPRS
jgi:hypothetical protein